MCGEIGSQPLDGEIGVDDAHHDTDTEEQQDDLDRVVNEEVDRFAQSGAALQTGETIDEPIGKLLYHKGFVLCHKECVAVVDADQQEEQGDDAVEPFLDAFDFAHECSQAVDAER